jgi:steroid delta-isomerase-like uncharacterized protein
MSGNVDLVRSLYEAMNSQDVEAASALLAPDCEWVSDPRTGIRPKHGRDDVVAFFLDQAEMFGEVAVEVDELRDAGDRVVALIRVQGSGFASGASVEIRIGHVFEIRDGKIVRGEGFGDRESALQSVGLTE